MIDNDSYVLLKTLAVAEMASRLVAANNSFTAESAVSLASDLFDAAEKRIVGPTPLSHELSTPDKIRLIRLCEKLRFGALDSQERVALADLVEGRVRQ